MSKKVSYIKKQAKFYDKYPPLVPWPNLLQKEGFSITYKPRECFWKIYMDKIFRKGDKVLDVGCGQGLTLSRINKTYGVAGIGVDVSEKSVKYANKNYSDRNIGYQIASATKLPFERNSFDVVVTFDVLEHIEDQGKAVSEMVRVLKPKGKLLIYTMNSGYQYTLDWVWEKLGFDIFSRAAHRKELFVVPKRLNKYLSDNGCRVETLKLFDAFFTLGLDESIMVGISVVKKLGLLKNKALGKSLLKYYDYISRKLFMSLYKLDGFWYKKGKSISFLVVAQKK